MFEFLNLYKRNKQTSTEDNEFLRKGQNIFNLNFKSFYLQNEYKFIFEYTKF